MSQRTNWTTFLTDLVPILKFTQKITIDCKFLQLKL